MVPRPLFKCECGNDQFHCQGWISGYAEIVFSDDGTENGTVVFVDASTLEDDDLVGDIEGPFHCTKCHKEYSDIPPSDWTGDTTPAPLIHTADELNIFGGRGEVK